jgi:hypothetical protein
MSLLRRMGNETTEPLQSPITLGERQSRPLPFSCRCSLAALRTVVAMLVQAQYSAGPARWISESLRWTCCMQGANAAHRPPRIAVAWGPTRILQSFRVSGLAVSELALVSSCIGPATTGECCDVQPPVALLEGDRREPRFTTGHSGRLVAILQCQTIRGSPPRVGLNRKAAQLDRLHAVQKGIREAWAQPYWPGVPA